MDENQDIQEELSKVNINGQEYDPTEAQELIEAGRRTREAEQKYNITFDSIMPAYTKANEGARRAEQLETELSEARAQLEDYQKKQNAGTETPADFAEAKEAARKLGLTFQDDLQGKYMTREEVDKYLEERDSKQNAVKAILREADELETKYNGEDGRPKFNKRVVLAYAQAYGSESLQAAYEDMHADALKHWQEQQIAAKKQPGLKTLASQQGNKRPADVKVTAENSKDLLREALFGAKE